MTQSLISMDKKYRTRDGNSVRILCTDLKDSRWKVVAAVTVPQLGVNGDSMEVIKVHSETGKFGSATVAHSWDLIEVSPAEGYKVDDPVWVRDSKEEEWIPRYFAKYENDTFYAWVNGATSFSVNHQNDVAPWKFFTKENPND